MSEKAKAKAANMLESSNDELIDSFIESRQKISKAIEELRAKKGIAFQRKEELGISFWQNLNRPLSKLATVELVSRVVDKLAATFRDEFMQETAASCMKTRVSDSPTSDKSFRERSLTLDDVSDILETGKVRSGERLHGLHSAITWIAPSPEFLCFFFGDTIKGKVLPLWDGIETSPMDDGQSLEQRLLVSKQLEDEMATVDLEIAGLDAEIYKWQKIMSA